ncbi:MAG: alpha-glucan family phosphorylase [Planctomycetota bacterium]|jgi:starch phosphorylase
MIFKHIFVYPKYPESLEKLYLLAYNLWCTWNYEAINLFYRIDSQLFKRVNHNPVELLLNLPRERIEELSKDRGFLFELERVCGKFEDYMKFGGALKTESGSSNGLTQNDVIAYFAMEFGLHESIPIYGGGLGVLSGDFLKAASDLSLPVVGIGLIYKFGYFTQRITLSGDQEELFIEFENHLIPIRELRNSNGEKTYVRIKILKEEVIIKLWQVQVGQTRLILLDTDIEANPPHLRAITQHELYVADREKRLQQELVLGLGGLKALESLKIEPKIYHLNEGHSAFVIMARLWNLMTHNKLTFSEARALIQASTVFTTHTPVVAGNENFETELLKEYIEPLLKGLGLSFDELAVHGFLPGDREVFWLPAFAIRFSKYVNCVSAIHREVARRMWAGLFPQTPPAEIPIDYITNGVHSSWLSESYDHLLERHIGPEYIHWSENEQVWDKLIEVPDEEIWEAHRKNKQNLILFIRRKLAEDLGARGYSTPKILNLTRLLNPDYLTVVFARRFAHYKRPTLILKDRERLRKILTDVNKPVQLIFAGKAHPADETGKNMIKQIMNFARDCQVEDRVIFLENYDINVARHLVWGADVWLNTPIREKEASGTSGMKAAMNGVLNLSVLDGWWPECYNGRNGWAITAGEYYRHSDLQEIAEANQIYDLLEEDITPLYYERNEIGIPEGWVYMMKESISSACRLFNMNRVLMCYLNKLYGPSKKHFERLCGDHFEHLKKSAQQEQEVLKYWDDIEIVEFSTNVDKEDHLVETDRIDAHCTISLDVAPAELFSVELFYIPQNSYNFRIIPMKLINTEAKLARYECSFEIEGYGLQRINARIRPANETVQDLHPELVKWKE